ncbi:hypothetical protein BC833DRAFT_575375 [Globomyces pollinis-pini]|nr:hypothetical protein BC833DRAFT_575375 [Globomyces pollinis-pini]
MSKPPLPTRNNQDMENPPPYTIEADQNPQVLLNNHNNAAPPINSHHSPTAQSSSTQQTVGDFASRTAGTAVAAAFVAAATAGKVAAQSATFASTIAQSVAQTTTKVVKDVISNHTGNAGHNGPSHSIPGAFPVQNQQPYPNQVYQGQHSYPNQQSYPYQSQYPPQQYGPPSPNQNNNVNYNTIQPVTQNPYDSNSQPIFVQQQSYWSPITDYRTWFALFYYLLFNFIWSVFCFVWVVCTMLISVVLLLIFPIGFPLLFLSCISWRMLAKFEVIMLNLLPSHHQNLTANIHIWIVRPIPYPDFYIKMKSQIFHGKTWGAAFYFIFCKLFLSIQFFVLALLTLVFFIPFICVAPTFLEMLKDIYIWEKKFAQKCLC